MATIGPERLQTLVEVAAGRLTGLTALRQLGSVGTTATSVLQGLVSTTDLLNVASGVLGLTLGSILLSGIGRSTDRAADYQQEMIEVQRVSELASRDISVLGNTFLDLGARIPIAARQLAQAGVVAGQLGLQTRKDIEGLAIAAAKFATISEEIDTERATRILATTGQLFSVQASESERLASVFAKANIIAIASANDLFQAIRKFGGFAASLGMTPAEAAAIGAAIKQTGETYQVAGTSIVRILLKMQRESSRFSALIGTTQEEINRLASEDPAEALLQFLEAIERGRLAGLGMADMLDFLNINEQRTIRAITALTKVVEVQGKTLDENMFNLRDAVNDLSVEWKNNTEAGRQFGLMTSSLNARIQTLNNAADTLSTKFGQGSVFALSQLTRVGIGLLNIFNLIPEPVLATTGLLTFFVGLGLKTAGILFLIGTAVTAANVGFTLFARSILGVSVKGPFLVRLFRSINALLGINANRLNLANTVGRNLVIMWGQLARKAAEASAQVAGFSPVLSSLLLQMQGFALRSQANVTSQVAAGTAFGATMGAVVDGLLRRLKNFGKLALFVFGNIVRVGRFLFSSFFGGFLTLLFGPSLLSGFIAGFQDAFDIIGPLLSDIGKLLMGAIQPIRPFLSFLFTGVKELGRVLILGLFQPIILILKGVRSLLQVWDKIVNRGRTMEDILVRQRQELERLARVTEAQDRLARATILSLTRLRLTRAELAARPSADVFVREPEPPGRGVTGPPPPPVERLVEGTGIDRLADLLVRQLSGLVGDRSGAALPAASTATEEPRKLEATIKIELDGREISRHIKELDLSSDGGKPPRPEGF